MHQQQFSLLDLGQRFWRTKLLSIVASVFLLLSASPAMAHHAMGNKMPSNFLEGFLSGLAHPLIGPDHFAFIVAVGLLAAIKRQGILIPGAFILSAMLGTGFHMLGFGLPGAELFVSGSILLFGILLVSQDSPNTFAIALLAAIAGIFHGYAYGESIFGAETTPLIAYLIGFTVIQMAVAASAFAIAKRLFRDKEVQKLPANLRSAGLVICGIGAAFFSSQLINAILPVPKG
ncbi:HupE/UreJ family protein [Pseudanabaena sp. PCC 6802]|uniref:HupE/UreJ family protein n=1 Tax=Pseudanabaena sp. PCC 6802 TaxID=118173 RepID=UPI000347045B|nr:HupE/UreJ family protein [Pseudanabaena sp. PCC 6802]